MFFVSSGNQFALVSSVLPMLFIPSNQIVDNRVLWHFVRIPRQTDCNHSFCGACNCRSEIADKATMAVVGWKKAVGGLLSKTDAGSWDLTSS